MSRKKSGNKNKKKPQNKLQPKREVSQKPEAISNPAPEPEASQKPEATSNPAPEDEEERRDRWIRIVLIICSAITVVGCCFSEFILSITDKSWDTFVAVVVVIIVSVVLSVCTIMLAEYYKFVYSKCYTVGEFICFTFAYIAFFAIGVCLKWKILDDHGGILVFFLLLLYVLPTILNIHEEAKEKNRKLKLIKQKIRDNIACNDKANELNDQLMNQFDFLTLKSIIIKLLESIKGIVQSALLLTMLVWFDGSEGIDKYVELIAIVILLIIIQIFCIFFILMINCFYSDILASSNNKRKRKKVKKIVEQFKKDEAKRINYRM